MGVDLNKLGEKLKQQRNVGVSKKGDLITVDPRNDGSKPSSTGLTTLEPQKFFM